MKLNRNRALLLVGTIAAVGCVVESSDDDGAGDDNNAGEGGTAGSTGGKGGSSGSAGTYTGGTSGSGAEGGSTCIGNDSEPAVTCGDFMEPGAGGVGAGGEGYGGAGGVGPTCEGMADAQTGVCMSLWTNFKPGVANAARTCMNTQTPEDLCTWDFSFGCASEAILAACPDGTADTACDAIVTLCPDVTALDCSLILSGMTTAGREMVQSCAAEGYCDLWACTGVPMPPAE